MRHLLIALTALALAACGSSSSQESSSTAAGETSGTEESSETSAGPTFAMLSVEQVAAGIEDSASPLAVYDSNRRETFEEHHVPGAVWLRYDAVSTEALPADTAAPVVFYCANEQCGASHQAAEAAIALGYSNVSVMGAGIEGWVAAGMPVETAAAVAAE